MSIRADSGQWDFERLPPSWCWASFGEVFNDYTDGTRKVPTKECLSSGPLAVIDQGKDFIAGYTFNNSKKSLAPLPAIVWGDHTRCVKFVAHEFAQGADGVKVLVPTSAMNPHYSYFALKAVQLPNKGYSRHFKFLKATNFPIAPFNEQRRIVAKVESLLARTERASHELGHIPRLVERYKHAILAAAFRGDLTADWRLENGHSPDTQNPEGMPQEFEGHQLPGSWTMQRFSELAENFDSLRVPIKASDRALRRGSFTYFGASGPIDSIDDFIFDGDFLLIAEDGANLVARATPIAFAASGRFWVNNHAHVLQPKDATSIPFLLHYINSISVTPFVSGSAQPKLTQKALNQIGVPVPSRNEQTEIVRRVDEAFAWIDKLVHERERAFDLINRLDQSILTKAFRGELVPQEPNDEPASVLLDRIRAERAKAGPKKRADPKARARR